MGMIFVKLHLDVVQNFQPEHRWSINSLSIASCVFTGLIADGSAETNVMAEGSAKNSSSR